MRRILSAYFSVQILAFSAFGVWAGADLARRGSEKTWTGLQETGVTMEDLNKWYHDFLRQLYLYYKNSKIVEFFSDMT